MGRVPYTLRDYSNITEKQRQILIRKDIRARIKLLGGNFVKSFPKDAINGIISDINPARITFDELEMFLMNLMYSYLDLKSIETQRIQALVTADKFERISNSLNKARKELKALNNNEQIAFIRRLGRINLFTFRKHHIENSNLSLCERKIAEKLVRVKDIDECTREFDLIDVTGYFRVLEWLEMCARQGVNRKGFTIGHKDKDHHLHMLIDRLRGLGTQRLDLRFTRDFHTDGQTKILTPLSPAARFCCRVVAHMDSQITARQVESAMKTVITKKRTQVRLAGK